MLGKQLAKQACNLPPSLVERFEIVATSGPIGRLVALLRSAKVAARPLEAACDPPLWATPTRCRMGNHRAAARARVPREETLWSG